MKFKTFDNIEDRKSIIRDRENKLDVLLNSISRAGIQYMNFIVMLLLSDLRQELSNNYE